MPVQILYSLEYLSPYPLSQPLPNMVENPQHPRPLKIFLLKVVFVIDSLRNLMEAVPTEKCHSEPYIWCSWPDKGVSLGPHKMMS